MKARSFKLNAAGQTMVWFDLDDTLWDMWGNSVICLRELYDSCDLQRWFESADEWDRIYHEINRELWERYSLGEISRDYLKMERFARPLRMKGADETEAGTMSVKLDRLYLDSLGRKKTLISGAEDALQHVKAQGYRTGILSNGFKEVQHNKMKSSGIDAYFDVVVLSDDAGYNKPDRRLFEYAEEKAGSRNMRNVIIGDNLATDIQGALAADWDAVWFDRAGHGSADNEVLTISSLEELRELF